jgi:hypothetical protein
MAPRGSSHVSRIIPAWLKTSGRPATHLEPLAWVQREWCWDVVRLLDHLVKHQQNLHPAAKTDAAPTPAAFSAAACCSVLCSAARRTYCVHVGSFRGCWAVGDRLACRAQHGTAWQQPQHTNVKVYSTSQLLSTGPSTGVISCAGSSTLAAAA